MMTPPIITVNIRYGIHIVRDDLYPGGTKARYIGEAFDGADVVVYASPCEGGAQTALAYVARQLGKRAVIVCAKRRRRHPRTEHAARLGAEIVEIGGMAMLTVVQARARELAAKHEWKLAPFGLETAHAVATLRDTAKLINVTPDEVWCAASSGVLARGLASAWPSARRHVVQVGHRVTAKSVADATIHIYPGSKLRDGVDCSEFSSDRHYDAKAWQVCVQQHGDGLVLFWNVTGEAVDADVI
jgi:threonine dehydratase